MTNFIEATPLQKLTLQQLSERHRTQEIWVSYNPYKETAYLKALLFTQKYLFEYHIDENGYLKHETAYDNPHHVKAE